MEIENSEVKKSKVKLLFSKMGNGIRNKVQDIKESIEDKKARKELEEKLENEFKNRKTCQVLTCIFSDEKEKMVKITADVNYDNSTFIFYGENTKINKNCRFLDKSKQVFKSKLIRLNQETKIIVDDIEYTRPVIVVEFEVENDVEKQKEIKTIINNTTISVIDSKITKSSLGAVDEND